MIFKLKKGLKISVLLEHDFEKRFDTVTGKVTTYVHAKSKITFDIKKRVMEFKSRGGLVGSRSGSPYGGLYGTLKTLSDFRKSEEELLLLYTLSKNNLIDYIEPRPKEVNNEH